MAVKIRVLDAANRTMQRLGYLKLLCARTATLETSNISNLGHYLIEKVMKRVPAEATCIGRSARLRAKPAD